MFLFSFCTTTEFTPTSTIAKHTTEFVDCAAFLALAVCYCGLQTFFKERCDFLTRWKSFTCRVPHFYVCSEAFLQQNKRAFIFLNKCNILFHLALLSEKFKCSYGCHDFFPPFLILHLKHNLTYDREPQCSTEACHLCGDFILFFIFSSHPMISKYLSHRVEFPTFVFFPCFCEGFFVFVFCFFLYRIVYNISLQIGSGRTFNIVFNLF